MNLKDLKTLDRAIWLAIIVAALGYFVDIYDLLLFSIVRMNSLRGIGVPESELFAKGVLLINVQMAGLLIGGIIWGILGDKKGRLSVLFGSIVLYSLANLLNAAVNDIWQYAALRFIAGVGLAGELGAGITLVTEILPQRLRGYGTAFVASIGLLGAVFGGLVGDSFSWRFAFVIGGVLGLFILLLRVGVRESSMFARTREKGVHRGNVAVLFRSPKVFARYFGVILIGVPIWFVIGIVMTFTPEFAKALGMTDLPSAGKSVMFSYIGLSIGDLLAGLLSQYFESRKKAILVYMVMTSITFALYLQFAGRSLPIYYTFCVFLGVFIGYWALFVTVGAEQFGTNIRSTVATTVPNFVRGAVIPMTTAFKYFLAESNAIRGGVVVGGVTMAIALGALALLPETFHKDLDYHEA
jgi:putative MFS transporter